VKINTQNAIFLVTQRYKTLKEI